MEQYRLEMRDVTKIFPGVKALDRARLQLRPGTVHALMGENGAGKSTLIKCLTGVNDFEKGEIFFGKDMLCGRIIEIRGIIRNENFRFFAADGSDHRNGASLHLEMIALDVVRTLTEDAFVGNGTAKGE